MGQEHSILDDPDFKKLLYEGKLVEALNLVETFAKRKKVSPTTHLSLQLLKSRILVRMGDHKDGLELAKRVLNKHQGQLQPLQEADGLLTIGDAYEKLGKFNEGLAVIDQSESLLITMAPKHVSLIAPRRALLLGCKGRILWRKGHLNEALTLFQQSLSLSEEIDSKEDISDALNNIGNIFWQKGDLDRALEYYLQSLQLREEIGNKQKISGSLNNIGNIYGEKGELDRSLEYYQNSLILREKIGNKQDIAGSLANIGITYYRKGDLDRALNFYERSLTIDKEIGNSQDIALSLGMIGEIHGLKGDLTQALGYFKESLELRKVIGNKQQIAMSLNCLSLIFHQKGDLDQAQAHLEESLTISEEIEDNLIISETLFYLVSVTTDKGSLETARQYLAQLQQANEHAENKIVNQRYRVAEALVLKMSSRTRSRGRAEEILEQVAGEEIVHHELTVSALLNLCDLLLTDLRTTNDPEVLTYVQRHVDRLEEIAKLQRSNWLLAEVFVLRSKLALVELDLQEARRFLTLAQLTAEEWGLHRLAKAISGEHDELLQQTHQWQKLLANNPSLGERLDFAQLEDVVKRMARKETPDAPEQSSEDPVMLLIVANNGLSLYSRSFLPESLVNGYLVGSFLTAIKAFGSEVFAGSETVDRIMYQKHTLAMKAHENMMFCYVFKGQSYSALKKLDQFMETVQASPEIREGLHKTITTGKILQQPEETAIEGIIDAIFPSIHL
ncbi:MAG: tetratricopeptide repeat protein [Candidatus Heimdallarchaeota archaeon]